MAIRKDKLTNWLKGRPPMIGEYNASLFMAEDTFSWWDGESWSHIYYGNEPDEVKRLARREKLMCVDPKHVLWRGLAERPENFVPPEPLEPL